MTISRGLVISPDVLQTGYRTVQLPHPTNGDYRGISANRDGLQVVLTQDELRELKRLLNEMNLE